MVAMTTILTSTAGATYVMLYIVVLQLTGVTCANLFAAFKSGQISKERRSNCSDCGATIKNKVDEKARLKQIKAIVWILTRNNTETRKKPEELTPISGQVTQSDQSYPGVRNDVDEVIFRSSESQDHDSNQLQFRVNNTSGLGSREAVKAYLCIFFDRRKTAKKGKRGKKILLTVRQVDPSKHHYEILTYLRTRVKKRHWQKVSLPLHTAQALLDSKTSVLNLEVTCSGCGKLVRPLLYNINDQKRHRRRHKHTRKNHKRLKRIRKMRRKTEPKKNTSPYLVIAARKKF